MQGFMITLLTCSATMSAVALLYMAVTPVLNKRYSERGHYYAWLIVVLGLIIPFRPQLGGAIATVTVPVATAIPVAHIVNTAPAVAAEASVAAPVVIQWWQIAAMVWIAGMVIAAALHVIRHLRFVKTVKRWSAYVNDERTLTLFDAVQSDMGITGRIGLYRCASVGSPMLIGLFKPRILLPDKDFAPDELHFVLTHELIHYKRKDLYYKALVLLTTCIHWFNPIVYLMAKAINAVCEISCDAEVVRSTDMDNRRHYSETIIGLARHQSKLKTALSTNFYGGKTGMKKRIFSIMDMSKKRIGIIVLCAALIATLGSGFILTAHAATAENAYDSAASYGAFESDIDAAYIGTVSVSMKASIEPYKHLGLSVDDELGAVMYDGHPVREIFDPLTGMVITESMGPNSFNGRELANAVDLTVLYESDEPAPTGFSVSTQAEFDARTEERRNGVRYTFEADVIMEAAPQEQAEQEQQRREERAETYAEYAEFGMTYDIETDTFTYDGKVVRDFYDSVKGRAFTGDYSSIDYANYDVCVDLRVVYSGGKLSGLEPESRGDFDERSERIAQINWNTSVDTAESYDSERIAQINWDTSVDIAESYDPDYKDKTLDYLNGFGITYDDASKEWLYNGKKIDFLIDEDYLTFVSLPVDDNGSNTAAAVQASDGVFFKVIRKSDGSIEGLTELSDEEALLEIKALFGNS